MAQATTQLGQDPKYERFLHAPLGEDRRGSIVTVLSMFARLGVDPWTEASKLSKLPESAARQRLEELMARFHDVSTPAPDRGRIVQKLLAFLPRPAASASSTSDSARGRFAFPSQGSPIYWILAAALLLGWGVMLAQSQ
ncbi:hypothetical protein SAMN05421688_0109 [Poseidonocella pacifica]|uniref:Uncharacterized protein n=1 Tax=Poseidonocella pacifica TaxID=871651 RepID=A0A1I0V181_9RHOB|nr:hypothetical protein [Poseidonocella pacifica]SFA69306.1 hypothetical protein SAMN05421688_0109 [Poseidonocella pacifica]